MLRPISVVTLSLASLFVTAGCDRQRDAAEAQIIGTWHGAACIDCTVDLTLYPNHTFISSGWSLGKYWVNDTGKWYLDYKRIFLRRKGADEHALVIMTIADVTPEELKIQHDDWVETYRRGKTMTPEEIQREASKPVEHTITP